MHDIIIHYNSLKSINDDIVLSIVLKERSRFSHSVSAVSTFIFSHTAPSLRCDSLR